MIHSGIARRAFHRTAKAAFIYRANSEVPGQLNAIPGASYQDTAILTAGIGKITQHEKRSAAGAYDEVEQVITFEAKSVAGRPELINGETGTGDIANIGGIINNGVCSGGVDFEIIDAALINLNGFKLVKLYVKAVK